MPDFKKIQSITGVNSSDQKIEEFSRNHGVPEMKPQKKTKLVRMSLEMPDYVRKQLKDIAHQDDVSVKYIVLKILQDAGLHVHETDLVKDGRRER